MLERIAHPNGVVFYRSTLLAHVPHGFSTRLGGVSTGPFASLNLGTLTAASQVQAAAAPPPADPAPAQDDPANIQTNYERVLTALGLAGRPRAWVEQIHSSRVERIEPLENATLGDLLATQFRGQRQADALVTELADIVLTVRVADCVPLLLADSDGRVIAAVHAGWRGVVNNIAGRAVRALGESGVLPSQIRAALGPCIGSSHFEVGPEVASFFDLARLSAAVDRSGTAAGAAGGAPRPHVDLARAVALQLAAAGVTQIDGDLPEERRARCTFQNQIDFFSHRRDRGVTGRMAALIALPMRR
jgi:YfiH family protein